MSGCRFITEKDFRDELILKLSSAMGKSRERKCVLTDQAALIVESGMAAQFLSSKGRFQYCKLTGQSLKMY